MYYCIQKKFPKPFNPFTSYYGDLLNTSTFLLEISLIRVIEINAINHHYLLIIKNYSIIIIPENYYDFFINLKMIFIFFLDISFLNIFEKYIYLHLLIINID